MEWEEDRTKINFIFYPVLLEYHPAKWVVGDDLRQSLILHKRQLKTKEVNGFLNKVTEIVEDLRYYLFMILGVIF